MNDDTRDPRAGNDDRIPPPDEHLLDGVGGRPLPPGVERIEILFDNADGGALQVRRTPGLTRSAAIAALRRSIAWLDQEPS